MKSKTAQNLCNDLAHKHCFSWSAIISGAFVALGLGFLLQLLSVAIGLSAFRASSAGTLAISGIICLAIVVIVSMGVAGYVAGYLGRYYHYHATEGLIYGFITWCVALLFTILLMLPLSQYATQYSEHIGAKITMGNELQQNALLTTHDLSHQVMGNTQAKQDQTEIKVSPNAVANSSWVIFGLFLIGAMASCIGACSGMSCRHRCRHHEIA